MATKKQPPKPVSRVLDLRPLVDETLELIINDEETIRLRKPTELQFLQINEFIDKYNGDGSKTMEAQEMQLELLNSTVCDMLNNNAERQAVEMDWVRDTLPISAKMAIIEEYMRFAMSYNSPNSGALSSPAK